MTSNTTLTICGTALLAALAGSVVALALHGTIAGGDALAFLGGIVTLAGGIISHALGVSAGAKAATSTNATPAAKP